MNAGKALIPAYLATLLFAGQTGFAQIPDALTGASPYSHGDMQIGSGEGQHAGMIQKWTDELGLTAQQKSDIQIIVADYAPRFRDISRLGRVTARQLLETAPDDPAYFELTQEASALAASSAGELVTLLAEMRGKLYAILTPEQHQKLEEIAAEAKARHAAAREADSGE
jgi:Spy/CpxP family protein refolding chaperone